MGRTPSSSTRTILDGRPSPSTPARRSGLASSGRSFALERFVAGEPLYRVHECVFGILALESEPVGPRL